MMIRFLGSKLSIAIVELSIELSSSPLAKLHMHCIKLLSKVCVKQHLEALFYLLQGSHLLNLLLLYLCVSVSFLLRVKWDMSNSQ